MCLFWSISTSRLHTLRCFHVWPINPIVFRGPQMKPHLKTGFPLRCFQRLSLPYVANQRCPGGTTGTLEVRPSRSSRTRDSLLQVSTRAADRDRTVSRRSEPSSRAALMGEQPNPWDLLQPQDATSRHRGAKPSRRYGLLGKISLLSPGYLLSVERHHIHK